MGMGELSPHSLQFAALSAFGITLIMIVGGLSLVV